MVRMGHLDLGDHMIRAIIAVIKRFVWGDEPLLALNGLWEIVEGGGTSRAAH